MTQYVKPFAVKIQIQGNIRIPIRIRDVLGIVHNSLVYVCVKKGPQSEWGSFSEYVNKRGRVKIPIWLRKKLDLNHNDTINCEIELAPKEAELNG